MLLIAGLVLGLGLPQVAAADDLDGLMSESLKESDKRQKQEKAAEGKEAEPAKDDYSEPDAWEAPPGDPEPPPKEEPQAAPEVTNPPDGRRLQLGLLVGYGLETSKPFQGANQYGLGFGIQGGYTLDMGIFLGIQGVYYLGSAVDQKTAQANVGDTVHALSLGAEVGYDIWMAGTVMLRISAQLGGINTMAPSDPAITSGRNYWTVYIGPGATFMYPFADLFYIGLDGRLPIVFDSGSGNSSLIFTAVGGIRLD